MYVVSGIRSKRPGASGRAADGGGGFGRDPDRGRPPGGAFSGAWNSPTEVGAGFDIISGTGNQNQFDNLLLQRPPVGQPDAQLRFHRPRGYGYSYSAGGEIYYQHHALPLGMGRRARAAGRCSVNYYNPQQIVRPSTLATTSPAATSISR